MAKTVTTTENTYDDATGRLLKQVVTVEESENAPGWRLPGPRYTHPSPVYDTRTWC